MHAEISFPYNFIDDLKKLDKNVYETLRIEFPAIDLPEQQSELSESNYSAKYYWTNRHIIDMATTGKLLSDLGLAFTIHRFKSTYVVADSKHTHIHIAIPNILLFAVDEVIVLEDACTDTLQDHLNNRWRILAVCPPPAQRRPDYILGRQKQEL